MSRQMILRFGKPKNHRPDAKLYEMDGLMKPLVDWAYKYGISYQTVYRRLGLGWPLDKALKTKPMWRTNGSSGETVIGSKWQLEEELNETPFDKLPEKFRRLVKTRGYKGKAPYSGKFYGRFLREACKKEFDAYWKFRYQPKCRADYYHDKHTKQLEQKVPDVAAPTKDSGNPKPDSGGAPVLRPDVRHLAVSSSFFGGGFGRRSS